MKQKTIKQALIQAIKELNDTTVPILYERLYMICEHNLAHEKEIREELGGGLITPDFFIDALKEIKASLDKHIS